MQICDNVEIGSYILGVQYMTTLSFDVVLMVWTNVQYGTLYPTVLSVGFVKLLWSHFGDVEVYQHVCCYIIQLVARFWQLAVLLVGHYIAILGKIIFSGLGVCIG